MQLPGARHSVVEQGHLQGQAIHTQWNRLGKTIRRLLFGVTFRDQVLHVHQCYHFYSQNPPLYFSIFPLYFSSSFQTFCWHFLPFFSCSVPVHTHTHFSLSLSTFASWPPHFCPIFIFLLCFLSVFLSVSPCIGTVWEADMRPEWGQIKMDSSVQYIRKQSGSNGKFIFMLSAGHECPESISLTAYYHIAKE